MKKHMHLKSFVFSILLFSLFLTSVAYSAFATSLAITSDATFRASADIRITSISLSNTENGALVQYEPEYTINTITTGFVLPNSDSSITYKVTVKNFGDVDQTIYDITKVFGSDNVYYEILDYKEKAVIKFNSEVIFYVKFKTSTPSTDVVNYKLNFNYKKVYYVSYDESLGSSKPETQIKYEGVNLTLTDKELTNPGYSFEGWSDEKNSNVVKYYPGDIYNKDENIILYPVWGIESYKLRVNPNGGKWNGKTGIQSFSQDYGTTFSIDVPEENAYYTIKYNANGGTIDAGDTISYRKFTGWTLTGAGTITNNEPAETSGQTYIFGSADALLTANYNTTGNEITTKTASRQYIVTYNLNGTGATTNNTNNASLITYGMDGWYTLANGGVKRANNGSKYAPTLDETLYAHWTTEKITLATISKKGYTCSWNTKQDGTGTSYPSGKTEFTYDDNIILYAICNANKYVISYDKGDSTSGVIPSSQDVTYDSNVIIANNELKKNGTDGFTVTYNKGTATSTIVPSSQTQVVSYKADGWSDKLNGSKIYDSNKTIKYEFDKDITLYPSWATVANAMQLESNTMTKSNTNLGTVTFNYNYSGKEDTTSTAYTTYTANGWTIASGSMTRNYEDGQSIILSSNISLYPCFTQTKVSAKFPNPSRTGYTFDGWYTKAIGGEKVTSYTDVMAITLYAHWTNNEYEITYNKGDSTGGTVPGVQTVIYNGSVTLSINELTKSNAAKGYTVTYNKGVSSTGTLPSKQTQSISYTANGWSTTENGTKVYDSAQVINPWTKAGNLELYPSWTSKGENVILGKNTMEKTYDIFGSVEYDCNYPSSSGSIVGTTCEGMGIVGGSDEVNYYDVYTKYTADGWSTIADSTKKDYSNNQSIGLSKNLVLYPYFAKSKISPTLYTPSYEGYTFLGWYTSATGGEKVTSYTDDNHITLYAHWAINKYTISYNKGTATSGTLPSNQTGNYNTTVTIGTNSMIKSNTNLGIVTFNYNYSGKENTTSNAYTKYTANGWTTKSGSITRNYENGQSITLKKNISLYPCFTQAKVSATFPTPTRTGYTFNGWYTAATGGEKVTSYTGTTSVTYYAHWTIDSHNLSVNPNGGVWSGSSSIQQFTQNYATTKTIANPTTNAYYTIKYNANGGTVATGNTLSYRPFISWTKSGGGSFNDSIYTFGTSDGTLTANYNSTGNAITTKNASKSFTVTYNINSTGATSSNTTGTSSITYTMDGWYTAASEGTKRTTNGGSYSPTTSETLYAQWSGSLTLPTLTKTGYTCTWNTSADGTGTSYASGKTGYTPSANTTLYARCSANTYTINYALNGGTAGNSAPTSGKYDSVVGISKPTRTGYTFTGWTVTSGLNTSTAKYGTTNTTVTTAITSSTMKVNANFFKNLTTGSSVTLTANWSDTTKPSSATLHITLASINSHDSNKPGYTATITGKDTVGITKIQYSTDGGTTWKNVSTLKTGKTGTGTQTFTISKSSNYTLRARVCDAANNCLNTNTLKILPKRIYVHQLYTRTLQRYAESEDVVTTWVNDYSTLSSLTLDFFKTAEVKTMSSDVGKTAFSARAFNGIIGREGTIAMGSTAYETYIKNYFATDEFKSNATNMGLTP